MEHFDILIIGGGAAGIAAAKECAGFKVLLADRKPALGGVLLQCTHHGFGKNQSGVQYAADLTADFPGNITWRWIPPFCLSPGRKLPCFPAGSSGERKFPFLS